MPNTNKPTVPYGPKHPPYEEASKRLPSKHRPLTPVAGRRNLEYLSEGEKLALALTYMRERPARSLESIARDVGLSGESLATRAFNLDEEAFREHRHDLLHPTVETGTRYEPLESFKITKLNMDGSKKDAHTTT